MEENFKGKKNGKMNYLKVKNLNSFKYAKNFFFFFTLFRLSNEKENRLRAGDGRGRRGGQQGERKQRKVFSWLFVPYTLQKKLF